MEVGDLTFIGEGCRGPLRCDRVIFPREMISQDMDYAGGNKPVEVQDPEDSFTMVAFFGQQRSEPLVAGEWCWGGENARDSVAVRDMCRLGENGASVNVGSDLGIGSAA